MWLRRFTRARTGSALLVYLRTVGYGGAIDWAGSVGSTGACNSRVVWAGDEGL